MRIGPDYRLLLASAAKTMPIQMYEIKSLMKGAVHAAWVRKKRVAKTVTRA